MRLIDADFLKSEKVYSHERHEYVVPVYTIDMARTIDRPHGEWIPCKDDNFCKCSECKQIVMSEERSNFCPNCGADMRKREGDRNENCD